MQTREDVRRIVEKLKIYVPKERYCMGFRFTISEDWRMWKAGCSAAEFMKTYGKGMEQPMVDTSNYYMNNNEEPKPAKPKVNKKKGKKNVGE